MSASACLAAMGVGSKPFVPAPRVYTGCMGRTVPGLPRYVGDYDTAPGLLFSWLLHRVPAAWQQTALGVFKAAGDEDFLLSWPDFESQDPVAFGALIQTVTSAGFRPCVFLSNRNGPRDLAGLQAVIAPVLPILKACGVPRVCVGWELDSWIDPGDDTTDPPRPSVLEPLIDWLVSTLTWGAFLYVHFDQGVSSWQPNGELFANFWNWAVNKLRGVLHQKIMTATDAEYQTGEGGLRDILLHFNGGSGCTPDSGDGTPFDLVAFEVDLELVSEGTITEAEMHRRASVGVATPPTSGPTGTVTVMGSGCGL